MDTYYFIEHSEPDDYTHTDRFKSLYNLIKENKSRYYKHSGIVFFNPCICFLLTSKKLKVLEGIKQKPTEIAPLLLLNDYKKGFEVGEKEFISEYHPSLEKVENKTYVQLITRQLLEWHKIQNCFVDFLSSEKVYQYGFLAGKMFQVQELLRKYYDFFKVDAPDDLLPEPQPKPEAPELIKKQIIFNCYETVTNLHSALKGCFPEKEAELLKALEGEDLKEILLFPHNASSFIEVFKRLKYNGLLISTPTEIKDWICKNFNFVKTQGQKKTVEAFKENSVWDVLTKTKCEPSKKNRICTPDWLPFIPQKTRQRQAEEEKL
jgi:hypothetical protein